MIICLYSSNPISQQAPDISISIFHSHLDSLVFGVLGHALPLRVSGQACVFWCSCLFLHSFKITFSYFVLPSMIGRHINCCVISSQPLLDTPPQQGVTSESRGSFWICFGPEGWFPDRQLPCGLCVVLISVLLLYRKQRSTAGGIIWWSSGMRGRWAPVFPCRWNISTTAHKCQETKEDVFHQLGPKYCNMHEGRHH